ncbi:hypothetical protein H257_03903 [Aphanomyces astaci]|uniref:Uncharacterized protein n=1 Tax=Aphanomyces astaci TaxID=112090 RepID=W4H0X5_APHAT|nr:hypothetical protein H257_03903 [Aphanomyces astaci]ETV84818.1 hypothetical protein H257_03903 [Aphanomyces astaci]|eukprot:XP_009826510.1 hypothetical protein H257_03903 [Aphanomyces astaci]
MLNPDDSTSPMPLKGGISGVSEGDAEICVSHSDASPRRRIKMSAITLRRRRDGEEDKGNVFWNAVTVLSVLSLDRVQQVNLISMSIDKIFSVVSEEKTTIYLHNTSKAAFNYEDHVLTIGRVKSAADDDLPYYGLNVYHNGTIKWFMRMHVTCPTVGTMSFQQPLRLEVVGGDLHLMTGQATGDDASTSPVGNVFINALSSRGSIQLNAESWLLPVQVGEHVSWRRCRWPLELPTRPRSFKYKPNVVNASDFVVDVNATVTVTAPHVDVVTAAGRGTSLSLALIWLTRMVGDEVEASRFTTSLLALGNVPSTGLFEFDLAVHGLRAEMDELNDVETLLLHMAKCQVVRQTRSLAKEEGVEVKVVVVEATVDVDEWHCLDDDEAIAPTLYGRSIVQFQGEVALSATHSVECASRLRRNRGLTPAIHSLTYD